MLATRIIAARRLPQVFAARRCYSAGRSEGSVAESKGFNEKEKAHENQYIRQHEIELLKKMRADIDKKKAELDALEREHVELEKTANSKQ